MSIWGGGIFFGGGESSPSEVGAIDFCLLSGGVTDADNNIYALADFSNMADAISALSRKVRLKIIDVSGDLDPTIIIPLKAGMQWSNVEVEGVNRGGGRITLQWTKPTVASGNTFANNEFPRKWSNIKVDWKSANPGDQIHNVQLTNPGEHDLLLIDAEFNKPDEAEEEQIIRCDIIDTRLNILMRGKSKLKNGGGTNINAIVFSQADSFVVLDMFDGSSIESDLISDEGGGSALTINKYATGVIANSQDLSTTVNNLSNTIFTDFILTDDPSDVGNNIYNDGTTSSIAMVAAINAKPGPKRLFIKAVNTGVINLTGGTGNDWSDVEIIGIGERKPNLNIIDGFSFANGQYPRRWKNVGIITNNASIPICEIDDGQSQNRYQLFLEDSTIENNTTRTGAFIKATTDLNIRMEIHYTRSRLNNAADESVFDLQISGAQIFHKLYDGSQIDDETLGGLAGTTHRLEYRDTDDINDEIPASFGQHAGTLQIQGLRSWLPLTTTQRNNLISLPAVGFGIYNKTINKYQVRENAVWRDVTTAADSA